METVAHLVGARPIALAHNPSKPPGHAVINLQRLQSELSFPGHLHLIAHLPSQNASLLIVKRLPLWNLFFYLVWLKRGRHADLDFLAVVFSRAPDKDVPLEES